MPRDATEFRLTSLNHLDGMIYNSQPQQPQQPRQSCLFDLFALRTKDLCTFSAFLIVATHKAEGPGCIILNVPEDKRKPDSILTGLLVKYFASTSMALGCVWG